MTLVLIVFALGFGYELFSNDKPVQAEKQIEIHRAEQAEKGR